MSTPICIHPDNPKIFEFRGQPRVLVTATEHYGGVMNRRFRFEKYLADAADKGMTLTRLFMLFRELQSPANPYSTCKPESTDYISPFKRVGSGTALDCQPQYDLNQWNDEFFDRLDGFLSLASDYGIVVEVVLFSHSYSEDVWALNPLNPKNNINGMEPLEWPDYTTTRHPALFEWQCAHARKIIEKTNQYDNIFYEICNEPGGGHSSKPTHPTPDEVDQWQIAIAELIRKTESKLSKKHMIAGQQAFAYPTKDKWEDPVTQSADKTFGPFPVDIVNMHPLPKMAYNGQNYDMGQFMAGQLRLQAIRDYALATYHESKPLNYDEDNAATQYKDFEGWTIHRKRAWTTLFCGAHYDMIDFSIWPYLETGTPDSQKYLRTWFKHLSQFIHSIDLVRARPIRSWIKARPDHVVASVFAVADEDICVYLADGRERDEQGVGTLIEGQLMFNLPEVVYHVACFSPVTGEYWPAVEIQGKADYTLDIPAFEHDLVIRIRQL